MKFIVAIIKPFKLDEVKESLIEAGVEGMTVSDVQGFGRQRGHTEHVRGSGHRAEFLPKIKIELALSDDKLASAIDAIVVAARTGKIGDGKIFVHRLDEAMRIRTGECGEDVL